MDGHKKYILLIFLTGTIAALVAEYIAHTTRIDVLKRTEELNRKNRKNITLLIEGLKMELGLNHATKRTIWSSGETTGGFTPTENDFEPPTIE